MFMLLVIKILAIVAVFVVFYILSFNSKKAIDDTKSLVRDFQSLTEQLKEIKGDD